MDMGTSTSDSTTEMNSVCLDVSEMPEAKGLKTGDEITISSKAIVRSNDSGKLYADLTEPEVELDEDDESNSEAEHSDVKKWETPAVLVMMGRSKIGGKGMA